MKRLFIVLVVVSIVGIHVTHAQEIQKGTSLFNAGLGFVPGWGLNASYDYGIVDTWGPGIFTVGGYVGFGNWNKMYPGQKNTYGVKAFAFSPRATYRYAITSTFEVFGAAMLGAIYRSNSNDFRNETNVFLATTVGCRYTFAGNISVFAETGFNEIAFLNGGLCFSF